MGHKLYLIELKIKTFETILLPDTELRKDII